MTVSSSGFVIVTDRDNNRLQKFQLDGTYVGQVLGSEITQPRGITTGADDSIYVTGIINIEGLDKSVIAKLDGAETIVDIIIDLTNQFDTPTDVAVTSGLMYVADTGKQVVFVFENPGLGWSFKETWDISHESDINPVNPSGVAVDSNGRVYVVDNGNDKIKVYSSNGGLQALWGSSGSGNSEFDNPWDVFVDDNNYVYVVDQGNHRIQKFDSSGAFITAFGDYGAGPGEFSSPSHIYETGNGTAYITDAGNNRVHIWDCSHKLCSPMGVLLDVSNDTVLPWEWVVNDTYSWHERVWYGSDDVIIKLNNILKKGCGGEECLDCMIVGDDCLVPFSFRTDRTNNFTSTHIGGNLMVDDINFSYWIVDTLAKVPYGSRLRVSEGGNWSLGYMCNGTAYGGGVFISVLVPADCKMLCNPITYTPNIPPSRADAHDALDDAMYRLLDQKLDVTPKDGFIDKFDIDDDGTRETCFDSEYMWFDAKDELGIQSMWGPETARLVVWT